MPLPAGWITNNSTDPDGDPLTAAWTFPYGTPGPPAAPPPPVGQWNPPPVTFAPNVGGGDTFVSANYTVGLTVTDSRGAPHSQNKTITVTGAPYPTGFYSPSHGCERRDWLGVCQERYINFNWNTVPNVNLYQIDLDCDDWLGCGGDRIRNFSGPVAYFDGLPNNVLASLDYNARIRLARQRHRQVGRMVPVHRRGVRMSMTALPASGDPVTTELARAASRSSAPCSW